MTCSSIVVAPCSLGRGLFATRDLGPNTLLFQFAGPTISLELAIAKGEEEGNALQIGPITYVDLEPPSVYANHSCEPNFGIRNGTEAVTLAAIPKGTELRFDYSTTMSERRWTMRCRCGASACRGTVTDFPDLPLDLRLHYLGLGIVQPFIVAEHRERAGAPCS